MPNLRKTSIYYLSIMLISTLALLTVGLAVGVGTAIRFSEGVGDIGKGMLVISDQIPIKYYIQVDTPRPGQITWSRVASNWLCVASETRTQSTADFKAIQGSVASILIDSSPAKSLFTSPPSWTAASEAFSKIDVNHSRLTLREIAVGFPWRFAIRRECYETAPNGQPTQVFLSDGPGEQSPWTILWGQAAGSLASSFLVLSSPWLCWLGFTQLRANLRRRANCCPTCGYSRSGRAAGIAPCPECGDLDRTTLVRPRQSPTPTD